MITVPKRLNRAIIVSAATGLAIAVAAPGASALAATHHGNSQGNAHVAAAKAPKAHKSHLKVTG